MNQLYYSILFYVICYYLQSNNNKQYNKSKSRYLLNNNIFTTCNKRHMDIFDYPDDYKPEKPLTDQQMQDITNYLKNHPLFMKELPQNIQDNEHLVALQKLKEQMDMNQDAQSLCTQGSQTLKKNPNNMHYLKLAYNKYTQAINLQPTQPALLAKLHCNRALINLKNKNYGKVIIDCKISLKHDPQYTKAYYRCAQAFIAVGRFKEALELLQKRQQKELQQFKEKATEGLKKENLLKEEKKQIKEKTVSSITEYCLSKKYIVIPRSDPLPGNAKIQLVNNKLSIPILFAYPQFNQMDMIEHSQEQEKVKTYIGQLFESPLPWDSKFEYNKDSCELFCQLSETRVMRVPKQARIQDIAKRVPIKGGIEIVVLAKDNEFYKIYLKGKEIL